MSLLGLAWRVRRLQPALAAVLFVGLTCLCNPARASCGQYVLIGGPGESTAREHLPADSAAESLANAASGLPLRTCDGPGCGNGRSGEPPPPTAPLPRSVGDWGLPTDFVPVGDVQRSAKLFFARVLGDAAGHPVRVRRPPRLCG